MALIPSQFKLTNPLAGDLLESAYAGLETALNLQKGERILIMANPSNELPQVAMAVYNAALELSAKPTLFFQSPRSRIDFADPGILAAIETQPEVMFTITKESLGNDPKGLKKPYQMGNLTFNHIFYYLIATGKSRGAWFPCADAEIFCRTVPVDYPLMWRRAKQLKKLFDNAVSIHIRTQLGTDLVIDLEDREGMLDDGDYRYPGSGGNLPAGEVFAIPNVRSHGTAVIDCSASLLGGTLKVVEPFRLIIENGKLITVEGGEEADIFQRTLDEMITATHSQIEQGYISKEQASNYLGNCFNLAEFGIGLNPSATIVGNMTEDEKVLNTCHVAIGDDCYGIAPAVAHLDLVINKPNYEFTLKSGEILKVEPLDPPQIKE